jgi:hypothetical protein
MPVHTHRRLKVSCDQVRGFVGSLEGADIDMIHDHVDSQPAPQAIGLLTAQFRQAAVRTRFVSKHLPLGLTVPGQ